MTELDALFEAIRARVARAVPGSDAQAALLAHLRNLARSHAEPSDYPDPGPVEFPPALPIAYAVCHPECGVAEFIVEGSTQECQHCGGLLFRVEQREYRLGEAAT